ncbi:hypothetical protein D3C74_01360 [compost metagenome]
MTAPWNKQDDQELTGLIKKAKRMTLLRNITISVVVTVVVCLGAIIGNSQFLNGIDGKAMWREHAILQIKGANLFESSREVRRGWLTLQVESHRYKVIEGVPVPWNTEKLEYSLGNNYRGISYGQNSISVPDPRMQSNQFEYYRGYNELNGQREMGFYVPGVNYNDKILNDLPALADMSPDKLVEMAISFDQAYTPGEVTSMLPPGLTQAWYWVDTYDQKEKLEFITGPSGGEKYGIPESSRRVYGYGPNWEGIGKPAPDQFIEYLRHLQQDGREDTEFRRIYDYLRQDKSAPVASDVHLLGVVLTGTAKELQALNGRSYVRGAVLGAIVDKY